MEFGENCGYFKWMSSGNEPCTLRLQTGRTRSSRSDDVTVYLASRYLVRLPEATISTRKPAMWTSWWTIIRQPFPE